MKRALTLLLAVLLVPTCLEHAQGDPPKKQAPPAHKLSPLMQLKLDYSKDVLEGLALEDFDKIGRKARSLKLLSTESGWNVIQTEEYATQSRDFRRTCDQISEAAKNKDIGRAALGYVSLTVRCVECHTYMRKHKVELTRLNSKRR